jgi:hypothetical protein
MADFDAAMARLHAFPVLPATRRDPTEADIAAFEEEIGGQLPADYREFLLRHGRKALGSQPRFRFGEPTPFGEEGSLSEFLGFSTRPEHSIVHLTMETYAGRVPDPTIPIARDAGGSLVLLGFDGPYAGKVYFWDQRERVLPGRANQAPRFENVYWITDGFTAFLESLQPDPRYRE